MHSFFEDIFQYEAFPTEYECFKQLKHHNIPNYVAIPWTQILNSHWFSFPGNKGRDYFLRELSRYKIDTENNFTICQHDSYLLLEEYFKHLKITKVFSTLNSINDKMNNIEIIPVPFAFEETFNNLTSKSILVSFVGSYTTHPIRKIMKENITGEYFIYRPAYHIDRDEETRKEEQQEYKYILERSTFSLCPRGSSPSSVRFWESLAAGCIPVLISDDWQLPEWDWNNTIIRIKEEDIKTLDSKTLSQILLSYNIPKLRKNCGLAYQKFKQERFYEYIKENL